MGCGTYGKPPAGRWLVTNYDKCRLRDELYRLSFVRRMPWHWIVRLNVWWRAAYQSRARTESYPQENTARRRWKYSVDKNLSEDKIANVNCLRRHRACRSQRLRPVNRLFNFYYNELNGIFINIRLLIQLGTHAFKPLKNRLNVHHIKR